jgi:hypothetical protein
MYLESLNGFVPRTDQEKSVLEGHYRTIAKYVQSIKWYIDALAKIKQPDFKKFKAV